jgi:hypothetical protein
MALGNWVLYSAGAVGTADEVSISGSYLILGRNEQVLELSVDGTNWDQFHTFPVGAAEIFPINVPSETIVRLIGPSQWALGRFNQMSG